MNILSRRTHGVADYALVVFFLSAPTALGLAGAARVLSYALAFEHLLLTGFSSFPPGAFPIIPLRVHGIIERVVGMLLIVAPWLLGFAVQGRTFFVVMGLLVLLLPTLTNFDRREASVPRPPGDRRRWFARKS